MIQLLEIWKW